MPILTPEAASSPAAVHHPLDLRAAIRDLVRGFSIEATVRTPNVAAACAHWLAPGTRVYISMLPGQTYQQSAALAAQLARAGLTPVPHVTARGLANLAIAEDFLTRVHGEAGVDRVLLLGGDRAMVAGPFDSSAALLATGMLPRHGIRAIEVAGYPEGHPGIAEPILQAALERKISLAREQGLELGVLTQFSFRPERIAAWVRQVQIAHAHLPGQLQAVHPHPPGQGQSAHEQGQAEAVDAQLPGQAPAAHAQLPMAVGIAGPANVTTLLKYALRCGVFASVGLLGKQSGSVLRLLSEAGPEPVVQALAAQSVVAQAAKVGAAQFSRCHLFSFGGIERTARWARAVEQGHFELVGSDHHLSVGLN